MKITDLRFNPSVSFMSSFTKPTIKLHHNVIEGLHSDLLNREVRVELFYPEGDGPLPLLILNDGQDAEALQLKSSFEKLLKAKLIRPAMIAAVHAGDRIREYGVKDRLDFKRRGDKANVYHQFIVEHLLPTLASAYPVEIHSKQNIIAGCSLGGLSAMSIAWNNPEIFGKVGAFSGAFWWRKRDLNKGYTDLDRIMHTVIRKSDNRPGMQFWFQAGTEDELSDRNQNGIIDAIDDTLDLIATLHQKGYKPYYDTVYYEMKGGKHNCETWAEALPEFLQWALKP